MQHIEFNQVTKSFGAVEVIPPLDLSIQNGEFVVLVGPSGCGKTTTLRMLAGLESASSGSIRINGEDVTDKAPGDRDCAMVFQNYALYPHMSVKDNITYAMRVHKVEKAEIERRVSDAVSMLGLKPYVDRKPRNLSGGQRQRVAIGRALVRQPQVFLFDEPLSNLDAKLRVEMRTEIKLLQRKLGTTAVYVTHDQVEAMTMADRVVVMRSGIVEQVDKPVELYDRPANQFVASFIGSPGMNFLKATVGNGSVRFGSQHLNLTPEDASRIGEHGEVIFGIRPEHFRQASHTSELSFHCSVVEPLGAHTLVLGTVGDQKIMAQVDPRFEADVGNTVSLDVDMTQAHYFDATSGQRL
ncbi:sn-glycerol-3-phosphate import ATP-binding protein UgpC [Labrenzia sp. THAF82]|uniref:ABC transporter ATP-binding protein n=1 Tax=Labrenzia sp. THAF82 TaxID=2587861 RepID=UPI0012AA549A|nr:sn-glycerol-3-phosphate ABC transporter ATP-binding protein UgpC [Labrenzia sp. THAF82]QFT34069.1 sn-glycerol-3-phosphate import ATP-binding protein UgpC [Labrenzia sp. THAF82]